MATAYQRTIDELLVRYDLEPTLSRDIYVEGEDDKGVIDALLEDHKVTGAAVFEASSVRVPTNGKSQRATLMKLARELSSKFGDKQVCVGCVIDSDLDHLAPPAEPNCYLLKTDYANMEMYFFSARVFRRLVRDVLRSPGLEAQALSAFMVPALQFLFRVRCVNDRRGWKMTPLSSLKKFVSSPRDGVFEFNDAEYLKRYLQKNGRAKEQGRFESDMHEVVIPSNKDERCFMHGHDFLELLCRVLILTNHRGIADKPEHLYGILRGCADCTALGREPMFAEILKRLV